MKHILLPLLLGATLHLAQAQTTLTLSCSQDAAIGYDDGASGNPAATNYGSATQNAAYCIPGIDPNGFNVNRALIGFNLASLPANCTIISAKLNLYAFGPIGSYPGHTGNANTSTLQRITQSWGEYTATWNNQPTTTTQNQVTLAQSTSATQNYLNVDVTNLVQDMLNNPASSFGFKLQLVNQAATNILAFASRDHANSALHPNLVVVYTMCSLSVSAATTKSVICRGQSAVLSAQGGTTTTSYSWSDGQQTIAQTATVSVSPASSTSYVVSAVSGACTSTAQVMVTVAACTGIKTEASDATIALYPNPNEGSFTIESEQGFDQVRITDLQGKLIKRYDLPLTQNTYSVAENDLAPGIYACSVFNGTILLSIKKIIVARQ